ncbi:MAG: chromate transporter [Bacilli bacterium]|nr:chromate transporter [Bacilli bacterium]MDD7315084.1 chromate transporter [Bacilli bacterium]
MKKGKLLLNLFLTMLKIGLFTFGGGYGMIALLESELVEKKKWIEKDEFVDMIAIAESTPGPIAVNASTYVGYKIAGFMGSLLATIGVCLPSFIIIFLISLFFEKFVALKYVAYAFKGIQVCVTFLIFLAGIKLFKNMKKNIFNFILLFITMVLVIVFNLFKVSFSTIYFILISALIGIFIYLIKYLSDKKKEETK